MELLQIATACFITKCDRLLLQIATAFLLQSATQFITNCDRYYKVRWIYYKLRQVLQSAMIITNCDSARKTQFKIPLHKDMSPFTLNIEDTYVLQALFRMGQRKGKRRAEVSTPWKRLTILEKKNSLKYYVYISSSCPLFGGLLLFLF